MAKRVLGWFAALLLVGCAAQSHVVVGTVRPPLTPDQVKIYAAPPHQFEQIAIVEASSRHSGTFTEQSKLDKAIARLKEEAAKVGANGVLLQSTGTTNTGSIGTGFGSASASGNTAIGTGFGFSANLDAKTATGMAIFVTQE
jgi:hypothetical protein